MNPNDRIEENNMTISDYLMLRRTVDVLYDIQDVRMRTANRLRLMPKKTSKVYVAPLVAIEDSLTKEVEGMLLRVPIYPLWLQKVKGIGPRLAGSIIAQTMIRFERVSASEYKKMSQSPHGTQLKIASHAPSETHVFGASHSSSETQAKNASQVDLETQRGDASHSSVETHQLNASQKPSENQKPPASHGSDETQPAIASQHGPETQRGHASQRNDETHVPHASHEDHENQVSLASQIEDETQTSVASQEGDETHCALASQRTDETHLLVAFSQEQLELAQKTDKGEYLIPVLRGVGAFDTVSKLWAWWGQRVVDGKAPKRSRGDRINWNPVLRTLAWKIGKQFVRQGEYYRKVYDEYKKRISATRLPVGICPEYQECLAKMKKRKKPACKGHVDAMARRYAVKMFLSHLWEKWRTLEGLSVGSPYVIDKLGHTTKMVPPHGDKKKL